MGSTCWNVSFIALSLGGAARFRSLSRAPDRGAGRVQVALETLAARLRRPTQLALDRAAAKVLVRDVLREIAHREPRGAVRPVARGLRVPAPPREVHLLDVRLDARPVAVAHVPAGAAVDGAGGHQGPRFKEGGIDAGEGTQVEVLSPRGGTRAFLAGTGAGERAPVSQGKGLQAETFTYRTSSSSGGFADGLDVVVMRNEWIMVVRRTDSSGAGTMLG